ncbi:hypothetical protein [Streptomyces sp. NBC_00829]|uniref:hypothetical protein n=1 Tax=Streptomyces sp. NBC_00829 TaxID=2903679 RepID=UPI003865B2E5|nr:hypothetical protein OG293_03295 [Streptomyces sp. NBC_00829]
MVTEEFSAVLTNGIAYAGRAATAGGTITWTDLSNGDNPGYPSNVCGITISSLGANAWVRVVTTAGTVFQTHGDVGGTSFVWDEGWTAQTTPVPGSLRAKGFKGDLAFSGTPNRIPPGLRR